MKLGKLPKVDDARNLRMANYLDGRRLSKLPLSKSWSPAVHRWALFENDSIGCCTCASAAHAIQSWTANDGDEIILPDAAVVDAYSAISGYDPENPETDRGASIHRALKHFRTVGIGGRRILGFAEIDPRDGATLMRCIHLFGGVLLGVALPRSAQGQALWQDTTDRPWSWGGHAVWVPGYDPYIREVPTWGRLLRMTPEFLERYCDEAYALVSHDWTGPDRTAPNGFELDALVRDLALVAS